MSVDAPIPWEAPRPEPLPPHYVLHAIVVLVFEFGRSPDQLDLRPDHILESADLGSLTRAGAQPPKTRTTELAAPDLGKAQ